MKLNKTLDDMFTRLVFKDQICSSNSVENEVALLYISSMHANHDTYSVTKCVTSHLHTQDYQYIKQSKTI